MLYHPDTIAAVATPPGEGGIAIIRISGPDAFDLADRVIDCPQPRPSQRPDRTFFHSFVVDRNRRIDEAICLVAHAPASYTTEHTVEIQCHGGSQSSRRVLRAILDAGARLAEPGEFTRRAFLNGRIDLVQAEAVLDLIRAQSDRASAAALDQLEGKLRQTFNQLYDDTLDLAADLEATLDFPEDELPETVMPEILQRIETLAKKGRELIATWGEGHLLRDGALVVISGQPNVGKSTLLNALLESERAIVSEIPGTTRDSIEEHLVLGGIPIRLVDTAGLRETNDTIEQAGIRRTHALRQKADLHLALCDLSQPPPDFDDLTPERTLLILNKADLCPDAEARAAKIAAQAPCPTLLCSLLQGNGVDELKRALLEKLSASIDLAARPHAVISERHRQLLTDAMTELQTARDILQQGLEDQVVLAASQLRLSLDNIGQATGREYQESLLDSIFSRFCIGK